MPPLEAGGGGPHSILLCLGLGFGATRVSFQLLVAELLSFPRSWQGVVPGHLLPRAGLSLKAVPQDGCDRRRGLLSTTATLTAPHLSADKEAGFLAPGPPVGPWDQGTMSI